MIDVSLLGRVSVAVDGVPLTGEAAQRRRLALLALLSVPTPRPLSRDRAMLFLWPDSESASARHLLSVAVHVLRRALGHEALVTTTDEIALAAGAVRVDVAAFEEALRRGAPEEALRHYGGAFMDGFHAGAGPELEQWVDEERTRLERAYALALEGAASGRRAAGDLAGAVEAWRRRVLLDPYSSHGALGLMRALAEAGDRAGAIRHAAVHRQLLDAELGAAADPEVEALAESLATSPPAAPVPVGAGASAAAVAAGHAPPSPDAVPAWSPPQAPSPESPVSAWAPPATPAPGAEPMIALPQIPAHAVPSPAAVARRRVARRWKEIALGALLLALAIYVVDRWRAHTDTTLVVLPCDNTSAQGDSADLGATIADDIRDALASVKEMQVVSRTSSMAMRGKKLTVPQIGDSLRAQWVFECNLRMVSNRVELKAALASARDGYEAWQGTWDRPSGQIWEIRDEIARGVADALHVRIERGATAEGGTRSLEAYRRFSLAQQAWYERTPASLARAQQYYDSALAIDPGYARAYAGLALTLIIEGSYDYGVLPPDSAVPLAKAAAEHALALAPGLAQARLALAGVYMNYEWRFADAEKEFRTAIAQDPGNSTARQWYALMLVSQKRFEPAMQQMLRSGESESSGAQHVQLAHYFYYDGKYELSLQEAQRALEVQPGFPRAYMIMAMSLIQSGRPDSAALILEALRAHAPEPAVLGALGYAYARAGRREQALECRNWLVRTGRRQYVPSELLALVDVGLNDLPRALQELSDAYRRGSNGMIYLAVEPAMAPLRSDSTFRTLVREVAAGGRAARGSLPTSVRVQP